MKREQKNRKPSPNKTHSSRRQCRHLARTRLHPPYTAKTRSLLSAVRERRVFLERREREKIKHGEQQQSHFYVSTYINARDFFFSPFLILYWAAKVREPLANLAVCECGLSFVVDPREAKAKRSSDDDDVFTGGRRKRQSRCCLAVYAKSGGQNWRTFTCGKRKTE